ncbi:unnamed protein product [Pleuronectes platessa]|uniref:Uncharacterized protein n=1 Tax=Pleuronectes platessa TaxID=8262 RepID=A0A9N7YRI6_PLEPL|nr:unnamed protein product [Pleuronectes platessa]
MPRCRRGGGSTHWFVRAEVVGALPHPTTDSNLIPASVAENELIARTDTARLFGKSCLFVSCVLTSSDVQGNEVGAQGMLGCGAPLCDLSAGPVMYCSGAGRTQSVLRVAAHCAMALRALQPPVPPHRYPAARHRALLIYCYTGFHN